MRSVNQKLQMIQVYHKLMIPSKIYSSCIKKLYIHSLVDVTVCQGVKSVMGMKGHLQGKKINM